MAEIVLWNCCGIRANFEELELLVAQYKPVAFFVQELQVSDIYMLDNKLYRDIEITSHTYRS